MHKAWDQVQSAKASVLHTTRTTGGFNGSQWAASRRTRVSVGVNLEVTGALAESQALCGSVQSPDNWKAGDLGRPASGCVHCGDIRLTKDASISYWMGQAVRA